MARFVSATTEAQTRCFVFVWRAGHSGAVYQSERYAPNVQQARARFMRDLAGKGRVMYAKEHTCRAGYANNGRFV